MPRESASHRASGCFSGTTAARAPTMRPRARTGTRPTVTSPPCADSNWSLVVPCCGSAGQVGLHHRLHVRRPMPVQERPVHADDAHGSQVRAPQRLLQPLAQGRPIASNSACCNRRSSASCTAWLYASELISRWQSLGPLPPRLDSPE